MRALRLSTLVLSACFAICALAYAQQTPAPDISLPPGDAARGKAIFESSKANCQSCHRVNGNGSLFGPDLSRVAAPPRGGGGGARGGQAVPPPSGPTPQQLAQS